MSDTEDRALAKALYEYHCCFVCNTRLRALSLLKFESEEARKRAYDDLRADAVRWHELGLVHGGVKAAEEPSIDGKMCDNQFHPCNEPVVSVCSNCKGHYCADHVHRPHRRLEVYYYTCKP